MMSLLNPGLWLIGIGMAIGLFFSGVSVGKKWEEGRQAVESNHVAEAVDAANTAAAEAIAKIRPTYNTIQGKLERQIEINTFYRDCRLDPVGVQLLDQALKGGAIVPDSGKLPDADTPGR